MKKNLFLIAISLTILLILGACSDSSSGTTDGEWTPEKSIEIVAPSGAGGGWDTTARMAAKVFDEEGIIDQNIGVVNKTGGGGAVGWAYIANYDGDPYHLFVASPPIIDVPLSGQSEYDHTDFTPIANIIADYGAFVVKADAKWDTLPELFDDLKEDPSSITVIGSSSPGSMDHLQFVRFAKAYGVDVKDIKYVSEQDGGELTALLNGSVDVFSTGVAETVEQVRAGNVKVLAVTSEERLQGDVFSDFPTAKEQGIDETFVNWRGFFGPPNMDEEARKYYENAFKELSDNDAWKEIRAQYGWDEMFMGSEEFAKFLDEQLDVTKELLDELGLTE
ncbi:Bug family tripartite tricarboxylate transporter substrate binding protein [Ornithinibacillus halotolerans]|uniref:Tricarboxylic transport TctC n=1 Tax=Ornithinibacillus halotolerans TaxID=1274357 RepID=A0A916SA17_9BACI|nr:tripartite tricarboxylate transporter substrate binding protein [Ornithinibacillus halotolerans]GGA91297.1 tricarboxylic transport TctC [Ornithinibacillus halotolerans]